MFDSQSNTFSPIHSLKSVSLASSSFWGRSLLHATKPSNPGTQERGPAKQTANVLLFDVFLKSRPGCDFADSSDRACDKQTRQSLSQADVTDRSERRDRACDRQTTCLQNKPEFFLLPKKEQWTKPKLIGPVWLDQGILPRHWFAVTSQQKNIASNDPRLAHTTLFPRCKRTSGCRSCPGPATGGSLKLWAEVRCHVT